MMTNACLMAGRGGRARLWLFKGNLRRDARGRFASGGGLPSLAGNIDKILNGTPDEKGALRQKYFKMTDTPQELKDKGLTGDYFSIRYGTINRHKGKDSDHNFTADEWKQICKEIANPNNEVEIYNGKKNAFKMMLGIVKNGKKVRVGVDVKSVGRNLEVNTVSTVFAEKKVSETEFSERAQFPNISAGHISTVSHPQNLSSEISKARGNTRLSMNWLALKRGAGCGQPCAKETR